MKTKVVIGSVLKPVDDIRHYQKIARTLATGKESEIEIHVGAHCGESQPTETNIHFHSLYCFSRLSTRRFFAGWKFFLFLRSMKPDVIICATHELLWPSVWYALWNKTKVVYDVQESYFHNIFYSNVFPFPISFILAFYVRIKELILTQMVDMFWLAEEVYFDQLPFLNKSKSWLLENKSLPMKNNTTVVSQSGDARCLELLMVGTLAKEYGTLDLVNLMSSMFIKYPALTGKVRLKIVGYAAQSSVRGELQSLVKAHEWIKGEIGSKPIPHEVVLAEMGTTDLVMMPYRFGKATNNRIPTKLWECMAMNIPFIVQHATLLESKFKSIKLYNSLDFKSADSADKLAGLLSNTNWEALKKTTHKEAVHWDSTLLNSVFTKL